MMHKMLVEHDPENGLWGDCHRTAIAGILGLHPSDVPHFYREGPAREAAETDREIQEWLDQHYGLRQVHIAYPGEIALSDVLQCHAALNPGALWMLGGTSASGCGHTVVCCGGEIIFDPSPKGSGITGPMEDGYWWVTFLAVADRRPRDVSRAPAGASGDDSVRPE